MSPPFPIGSKRKEQTPAGTCFCLRLHVASSHGTACGSMGSDLCRHPGTFGRLGLSIFPCHLQGSSQMPIAVAPGADGKRADRKLERVSLRCRAARQPLPAWIQPGNPGYRPAHSHQSLARTPRSQHAAALGRDLCIESPPSNSRRSPDLGELFLWQLGRVGRVSRYGQHGAIHARASQPLVRQHEPGNPCQHLLPSS